MESLTKASPRPDHVLPDAVYDFDMRFDPALLSNPHERVRELLRDAPSVFWTPRNGGNWIAIGHEEVFRAARDPEHFSSSPMSREQIQARRAMMPKGMPRIPQLTPITLDPPEHAKYRAPLQQVFSPKAAMARRESIRELADQLISAVIERGHCDFISAIAEPLPVRVFLELMGLPQSRSEEFRELVHEFLSRTMPTPIEGASQTPIEGAPMSRKVADAMLGEILARKNDTREDLISLLWQTRIDGNSMTLELMEDYAVLLFVAGLDTVINGIGFGIRHLALNPDLQDELRTNGHLIPNATEELLRRYTFVVPMRRVVKEVELGGRMMKPGDWVALYLPAANLDPGNFDSPERFDMNRENKAHIAFNAGVHRCLGAHLARLELQVLYTQVLTRLPKFRLDRDLPAKFHAGNIIAVDSLPIRWD